MNSTCIRFALLTALVLFFTPVSAQFLETFETETVGATSFSGNGQTFTITGSGYKIYDGGTNWGWNGTSADTRAVDNMSNIGTLNNGTSFSISTNNGAKVKVIDLYLFCGSNYNSNIHTGTLTIQGKRNGSVVYTITKSSGFNNSMVTMVGYTYFNFATAGAADYTSIAIDTLSFSSTGNLDYICLDAFKWQACGLTTSITSTTNITCNGQSNGILVAGVSGGTSTYSYAWSNGSTTNATSSTSNTVSALAVGTYTVTATDIKGCSATTSGSITQPTALSASTSQTNVACNGASTGTATVVPSGGTSPYTYQWSPSGGTAATASSLTAGSYSCTITDAYSCSITKSFTITQPTALSVSQSSTNVSCFGGSNGFASVSVSGATPAYTYSWSNGGATSSHANLSAGTYTLTVTDMNNCQSAVSFAISQPVAAASVTITSQTDVTCTGASTGAATALASGGTAPYTYSWSTGAATAAISSLTAGTYTVTVQDANACPVTTSSVTITEPATVASVSITSQTNVACHGANSGAATALATGGTSPYTYSWSTGASTASVVSLAAGTYTVAVQDANLCPVTNTSVTITQPATVASVSITSQTNVACHGANSGAATALATGGTSPYTYSWSTGASTASVVSLAAGTYTVAVQDANLCPVTNTSVTITEPATVASVSITSQTNVACHGANSGAATALATGGTSPYTYSWSTGATTASVVSLAAGTYTVAVQDANACPAATSSVTISQPASSATAAIASQTNVACYGANSGAATALASGGTSPYTYSWSTGASTASVSSLAAGTYTVSVQDANACPAATSSVTITQPASSATVAIASQTNVACYGASSGDATALASGGTSPYTYSWSTGASTASVSSLAAGTYTVSVQDANACAVANSTVTITEPASAATVAITSQTNVACYGASSGDATALASGGTSPYTYSWSTGASTASVSSLTAGTYTVSVQDANACAVAISTVTITEPASAATVAITSQTNVACYGASSGDATALASGGTSPYTYSWSTGASTVSVSSLAAGMYTVSVQDANACPVISASVTITEPASAATVSITSQTNVACNGSNTGAATAIASGGTAPYSYTWSTGAATASVSSLAVGTYTCTIQDANACPVSSTSVTITEPAALSGTLSSTAVGCNGASDGVAEVVASGGTGPYTYLWSSGDTVSAISGLSAGTYTITVTDVNNCSRIDSVVISEPLVLSLQLTSTDATCYGSASGSATAIAAGGSGAYAYTWTSGSTADTSANLSAGTYSVIVTDAHNCSTSSAVVINEPDSLQLSVTVTAPQCNGGNDGSAVALGGGGTTPYQYNWGSGQTSVSSINGLSASVFSVSIEDAHGCFNAISVSIPQPDAIFSSMMATDANCAQTNGAVHVIATGGTGTLSYVWSSGGTGDTETGLAAGNFTVTITDANGCSQENVASVSNISAPSVVETISDVTCNSSDDGAILLAVSGGIPGYTITWASGDTTSQLSHLSAGVYNYTIEDAGGCVAAGSVTISEPNALQLSATATQVIQGTDGAIDLTVTGGTPAYTYQWSNGDTSEDLSGLSVGTYTVTVTDTHGCFDTVSVAVTLNSSVGITSHTASSFDVYPNPNDGTFTLYGAAAIEIYSNTGQLIRLLSITDQDRGIVRLTDLPNGVYYLRRTTDNIGEVKKLVIVK